MARNPKDGRNRNIPNGGQGRPKGARNKLTRDLKEMIEGALHDAGGRKYLAQQALENPSAFLTLVGRIVPRTLIGDPDHPLIPPISRIELVSGGTGASQITPKAN